jgi:hypothetical protein
MEIKQYDVELIWTHSGQRHAYGDSHYECEIHTKEDIPEKDILLLVNNGKRLPYEEWKAKSVDVFNMDIYFLGYYTIKKTDYGYFYHGVYPYDD